MYFFYYYQCLNLKTEAFPPKAYFREKNTQLIRRITLVVSYPHFTTNCLRSCKNIIFITILMNNWYWWWIISILNKKGIEYLVYYMPPIPNMIWQDKGLRKTTNFCQNTIFVFVKTKLKHIWLKLLVKHFILYLLIFFSVIINP